VVFLDFDVSKKPGGIIGGIGAKSNSGKNMVGGISLHLAYGIMLS
jgi:hypothetical protein